MAINFLSTEPKALLAAFKKAIDEESIVTWAYDNDDDFTHSADQWNKKAWLRPKIQTDRLIFNIIRPEGLRISTEVYAIYHGRIIESFLAHFDKSFTNGIATAMPETGDLV